MIDCEASGLAPAVRPAAGPYTDAVSFANVAQYAVFIGVVTALVRPIGGYLERVFSGAPTAVDRLLLPLERSIYRLTRVDPHAEMSAAEYSVSFVLFGLVGTLLLYGILRLQRWLPWFFPEFHTTPLSLDLSLNTAVSFSTTTTWQAYGGESTMTYVSQMVGLCAQNFLAGAAGLAVGVAFIRGFAREHSRTLGNFWVDLTRGLLWVLLPGALIGAVVLVWQGVPMNFAPYTVATPLDGGRQVIAQGPVAALEIIKNLGTNGGGFFNANGAHPFENPTPLTNVFELLAIVLLPAALTNMFGRITAQPRQGWILYWAMVCVFVAGLAMVHMAEQRPAAQIGVADGANMEGKEARFGIGGSTLAAVVTSNAATGSYNSMHDSYTPLGGMVLLLNMLLGEVVFGGLGTGPAQHGDGGAHRRVSRRADDRTHPRVYWQENRTGGEQADRAVHDRCAACDSAADGDRTSHSRGPYRVWRRTAVRMGSPRFCSPMPRRSRTTARRSPA